MSPNSVIFALFAYPLLYVVLLNLLRFQLGFKRGSYSASRESGEEARTKDRAVLFVTDLAVLAVVALLMHGSLISTFELGLTVDRWKSAVAMGAMLSVLPIGLSALVLSHIPPDLARKQLESRGPMASSCAFIVLASFSGEFWRALCIAGLIRLGASAWLAVGITAVFFAAVSLQTSVASALGSAVFGAAAGFLFVDTGSLLAPLTMSFLGGTVNLYQLRHASAPRSRSCPVCGAVIRPAQAYRAVDMLACPSCGEALTTEKKHLWIIGAVSIGVAFYVTRHLVYREPVYFAITEVMACVLFFVGAVLTRFLFPPKYKRVTGKSFDKALSLFETQRPDADKKPARK